MSKQPWLFCEVITQMRQEGSPASSRSRVHPHRSPCVTWTKRNSVLPDRELIFFFFISFSGDGSKTYRALGHRWELVSLKPRTAQLS